MKLVSFSVHNYRSITATSRLLISDSVTTLIGPNNEGKSNVLRALVAALEVVSKLDHLGLTRHGRLRSFGYPGERFYNWSVDYPIALQDTLPTGESQFDLEFSLSNAEIDGFRREVGSSLNGSLPIRLSLGKAEPKFAVKKKGPGAKTLTAKASRIATFIGRRIDFQYIPAVRPASAATSVVEEIVARELRILLDNEEYTKAVERIEELQRPILQDISGTIRDTLKVFLPSVRDVQVLVPRDARNRALTRSCEVVVDDGTPTNLSKKGDGVQSLAALSLMRHASQRGAKEKQLILAIEEPESHLHPSAIHQLRNVLLDIAKQNQVIITTHCPLFVDRRELGSNVVVSSNHAARASSVKQIRDVLGVRVSDNLTSAEVIFYVEGEEDRIAMRALLATASTRIARALSSGLLAIDSLAGGGNLAYKLAHARDTVCAAHCLLDHDLAGRNAAQRAEDEGLLLPIDRTFTSCLGMSDSELEDWYDPTYYAPMLAAEFGVPVSSAYYTGTRKKWGDRMKELFISSGKGWDDATESRAKRIVAEAAVGNPKTILHPVRKPAFDNLVAALEAKLKK